MNSLFASLYFFLSVDVLNAPPDSYWDYFIFSFQTSTTLGFGYYLPKSNLAHIFVMLDTFSGIFYGAIITGLSFAKFAKPSSRISFTNNIIISSFDGVPSLMFRMVNARDTHIVNMSLSVSALIPYTSNEGIKIRRFKKLKLDNSHNPTFALSWTAMHPITDESPFFGKSLEEIYKDDIIVFVSLTGIDHILSQNIHACHRYSAMSIVKAKKFVDILDTTEKDKFILDYEKFHDFV